MMNTPLDEVQWQSPEWIQAFGLHTDNVLDYFSESPFFTKTSSNMSIRMQKQFQNQPMGPGGVPTGMMLSVLDPMDDNDKAILALVDKDRRDILLKYPVHAALERQLYKMDGVEFVVASVKEPDLWIIRRQRRNTREGKITILQTYYIVGTNVYQAPSVFAIVQSRMLATEANLEVVLRGLREMTRFEPSQGRFLVSSNLINKNSIGTITTTTSSSSLNSAVPSTAPGTVAATGGATGMTLGAATTQLETGNNQNHISQHQLDRLLAISLKTDTEYI